MSRYVRVLKLKKKQKKQINHFIACSNHLLIEISSTKLSRTAAALKFTHTKTDDYFLYIMNCNVERDEDIPPKKLRRCCPYTFGHVVHICLLVSPLSSRLLRPHLNLHLILVFLCVIFSSNKKKKKNPIMNPPPLSMIQMRRAQMIESE